jgi:hypothetical protein
MRSTFRHRPEDGVGPGLHSGKLTAPLRALLPALENVTSNHRLWPERRQVILDVRGEGAGRAGTHRAMDQRVTRQPDQVADDQQAVGQRIDGAVAVHIQQRQDIEQINADLPRVAAIPNVVREALPAVAVLTNCVLSPLAPDPAPPLAVMALVPAIAVLLKIVVPP